MGLLDELEQEEEGRKPTSLVEKIIRELGDEGAELEEALRNEKFSNTVIARILTRRGFPVSESSIRRYRHNLLENS